MTDHPEWWQDFFSGPVLDFVKESRSHADTLEETHFIEQSSGVQYGDSILDVPCGGGRLAIQLAKQGYQVTAVDFNQKLLESAIHKADHENINVNWQQSDMRSIQWNQKFDAAFCFWSSFGYFDESGNADFLRSVSQSLKPGAIFLLDTPLIETRLPEMESQERIWWPVGDLMVLEERSFDHETSRIESEWTFIGNGHTEKKLLSQRLYTYLELTNLLEQAGFGNHQAYGSLDWEPFSLGCTWLYLTTTKLSDPI